MKRIFALFLCLIIVFSVCSCDKTYSNQINVGVASITRTLDPQLAESSSELMAVRNMFEGLLRKDKDGNLVPAAAEEYSISGNEITFKLKKDLLWSNGEKLTAEDFVFGMQRAVNPITDSPYSNLMTDIKNAEDIINGKKSPSSLGVTAVNDITVKIVVNKNPEGLISLLDKSVFMPCNKAFFEECAGKYGRDTENIISNGSYKLSSWNAENFTVKLFRNKNYLGDFPAKTSNVVLQYLPMEKRADKFLDDGYDLIFKDNTYSFKNSEEVYKEVAFENTAWLLVFANKIPENIRRSFIHTASFEETVNSNSELKTANSIFPNTDIKIDIKKENIDAAKLFSDTIKQSASNKVPTYRLGYIESEDFKSISAQVAKNWQSQLGAFINIAPYESKSDLISATYLGEVDIMLYPIVGTSTDSSAVPDKFGEFASFAGISKENINKSKSALANESNNNLTLAQNILLSNNTVLPVAFSSEKLIYSDVLTVHNVEFGNGYIDFYSAVKIFE